MTKVAYGHIEVGTPEPDLWRALEKLDQNGAERHEAQMKRLADLRRQMNDLEQLIRQSPEK
jgi:hypothetical protein